MERGADRAGRGGDAVGGDADGDGDGDRTVGRFVLGVGAGNGNGGDFESGADQENGWSGGVVVVGQNFSTFNQLSDEEIEALKAQEYDQDRAVDDDYGNKIIIEQAANYLIFKLPKVTFATRIMEGNFPDVDRLVDSLPQEKIAVLNRKELLNAAQKVSVVNKTAENKDTRFQFVPGMPLTITAKTEGKKVNIKVPCEVDKPFSAAFNSYFLADMLKAMDDEEVEILGGGQTILVRTNDATHALMGLIDKGA